LVKTLGHIKYNAFSASLAFLEKICLEVPKYLKLYPISDEVAKPIALLLTKKAHNMYKPQPFLGC